MIRKFCREDSGPVMEIWRSANIQAHCFIDPAYWNANFEMVAQMLPGADVAVEDCGGAVQGFIGLDGNRIEGLFVADGCRSQGIGTALLRYAKEHADSLTLEVYEKNQRAVRFYLREGFEIREKRTDRQTGETELVMEWTGGRSGRHTGTPRGDGGQVEKNGRRRDGCQAE